MLENTIRGNQNVRVHHKGQSKRYRKPLGTIKTLENTIMDNQNVREHHRGNQKNKR